MGVLDQLREAAGGPPAAGKVPAPVTASAGASSPLDELVGPRQVEGHEQPPGPAREALDYLCRLATQASTDDVIDAATYLLDQATGQNGGGYTALASTEPVGTIAVLNLGSRVMAVVASQPSGAPAPRGQGQTLVAPGQLVVLPLGGTFHTIYGGVGDAVTVVRYASTRDPLVSASAGQGVSFTPNVPNPAAAPGALFYTAPFPGAIPGALTDWTVANSGATVARIRFFDGTPAQVTAGTAVELEDVEVPIGATVVKTYAAPRELLSGSLTCVQIAGDVGQPKTLVGVQ